MSSSRKPRSDAIWYRIALAKLSDGGTLKQAAEAAGISTQTLARARKQDEAFGRRVMAAMEAGRSGAMTKEEQEDAVRSVLAGDGDADALRSVVIGYVDNAEQADDDPETRDDHMGSAISRRQAEDESVYYDDYDDFDDLDDYYEYLDEL